jgi:hypothetical protein
MFGFLYAAMMSIVGIVVAALIISHGVVVPALAFLALIIFARVMIDKDEDQKLQAISSKPAGTTDSARRLYKSLANGANYPRVAVLAGAPGKLTRSEKGSFTNDDWYEWSDATGGRVSACFDNGQLTYFVLDP